MTTPTPSKHSCKHCDGPLEKWYKDASRKTGGNWRCDPCYKAYQKAKGQTPEYKAKAKARKQTPEYKAKDKARHQTLIDAGLCTSHPRRPADWGTRCWECVGRKEKYYDQKVDTEGKIADIKADLESLLRKGVTE